MHEKDKKTAIALIALPVALVVTASLFFSFVGIIKIEGYEIGVIQDWKKGVLDRTLAPGTHFYNNVLWDVHLYSIGTQKITFDSAADDKDAEWPSIPVEVGENGGQKANVSLSCNYHLDPTMIVNIHKQGIGKTYESMVLKREIVDIVNEIARPHPSALDIYSGAGFVKFKSDIEKALKENVFLRREKGIEIENTIIYQVHLDPKYEEEIAGKQIAQQQKLRKQEEVKAAEEEAKRIFAVSQAEVERVRQTAEASKITQVTAAEARAEQEVALAEAEKQKRVLEAEGTRDANLALASGVLAVGRAEAEVFKLKTDAQYSGESGMRRAEIEVAEKKAAMMKEILSKLSVLPEKTFAQIGKSGGVLISSEA